MSNIKVSVIVPVYNVELYLSKCLNSLVNQTMKEIEILVVNDGSPDNSQAIINDYVKRYPNKVYGFTKENGGLSDARNYGIEKAVGEYIAFVDSDDYVDINMYDLMYQKAKETDADVVNVPYSKVINRTVHRNYYEESMKYFGKNVFDSPKILRYANSFACNKIYRREFWTAHHFKFPVGQWFEDSALIYNVMGCANKVECVNIPCYYYVTSRAESITNTIDGRVFDVLKSVESIVAFYNHFPQTPELREEINYLCLRHTLARIFKLKKIKDKKLAEKLVDECYKFYEENLVGWRKNELIIAVKGTKFQQRRTTYIRRHKTLAKWYYVGETWYEFEKKWYEFVKKVSTILKKEKDAEDSSKQEVAAKNTQKRAAIKKNGVAVVGLVQKLLKELSVTCFADFGTLLGIVREGKLLTHDLDVDIGVIVEERTDIDKIRLYLEKFGFSLLRQYIVNDYIIEESYIYFDIKIDLNYYIVTENESKTWLPYREPDVKYANHTRNIVEMRYSPIIEMETVKVQGEDIVIPANAEQLLVEKYGSTWRIPNKKWTYWRTPATRKIPEIGYFIDYNYERTVEVNDEWFEKLKCKEIAKNRKYQMKLVEILEEVSEICKKHDIVFYLAKSTLRFAEYYNKLAPWESGMYLMMPKVHYDKFLSVAPKEISAKYVLQHSSLIEDYWAPNLVVRALDNTEFYHKALKKVTEVNGPCVQILPLCNVPKITSKKQNKQAKQFAAYKKALEFKSGLKEPKTKKDKLIKLYANISSYDGIHKRIEKLYKMFDEQKCDYVVNLADSVNCEKTTYAKEYFEETRYISFEGMQMPIPKKANEILEQRYGYNYVKSISWTKRKIGKGIVFVNKEEKAKC